MTYQIDKKIIEKTTNCEGEFECLETGICPKNKCEPTGCIDSHIIVKTKSNISCDYHIGLKSGASFCNCPTRVAIYKIYGV